VATTASTMSTAKPLLPLIALIMATSLEATYSSTLPRVSIGGRVTHCRTAKWCQA
jgi:hypothetical protein